MRLLPVLLIVAVVLVAGCAKKNDTPSTSTSTPPTGSSTTSTTSPTGSSTTTTTSPTSPTKPAPVNVCTGTFDFSGNQPTPPATSAASKKPCGDLAAGHSKLTLNVTWSLATPAPASVQNGAAVKLLGPDGTAAATCAAPAPAPNPTFTPCAADASSAAAGTYQLEYDGTGNLKATVSVDAS